jgi:hypothetical protein
MPMQIGIGQTLPRVMPMQIGIHAFQQQNKERRALARDNDYAAVP